MHFRPARQINERPTQNNADQIIRIQSLPVKLQVRGRREDSIKP